MMLVKLAKLTVLVVLLTGAAAVPSIVMEPSAIFPFKAMASLRLMREPSKVAPVSKPLTCEANCFAKLAVMLPLILVLDKSTLDSRAEASPTLMIASDTLTWVRSSVLEATKDLRTPTLKLTSVKRVPVAKVALSDGVAASSRIKV